MVAQHTTALEALLVDSSFNGEVYCNEPLARRTTYHIGGPARFYVQVNGLGALIPLIKACDDEDLPWIVLGKGSNILASDKGYEGLIITLGGDFKAFKYHEDKMSFTVGAGVNLAKLVQEAYKRSLRARICRRNTRHSRWSSEDERWQRTGMDRGTHKIPHGV